MSAVVVAVYSHAEWYPPTLNAIHALAKKFDRITVVSRNTLQSNWDYPSNCKVYTSGEFISIRESERRSVWWKVQSFLKFARLLLKKINSEKAAVVLIYDPMPLLAYRLIKRSVKHRHIMWYHSHDISEKQSQGKFSIGRRAAINEEKHLDLATIFSLPALERKRYFNLSQFQGKLFFLPNYPSLQRYQPLYKPKTLKEGSLRLLYQGSVTRGHGLENIIAVLQQRINDRRLSLTLIGPVTAEYRQVLESRAAAAGVTDQLTILDPVPYKNLPAYTVQYDIGIAIHEPQGVNFLTAGTASNKIYEYAALGLPVLLYDHANYRQLLEQFAWAWFTDCSQQSLIQALTDMATRYAAASQAAHADFSKTLNFENRFSEIVTWLESKQLAAQ